MLDWVFLLAVVGYLGLFSRSQRHEDFGGHERRELCCESQFFVGLFFLHTDGATVLALHFGAKLPLHQCGNRALKGNEIVQWQNIVCQGWVMAVLAIVLLPYLDKLAASLGGFSNLMVMVECTILLDLVSASNLSCLVWLQINFDKAGSFCEVCWRK